MQPKVFFPGLNGLRFLAASAVIITHIELLKAEMGLPNKWTEPLIFNLGGLGVYFFFVLSGFLITYLLLVEREKSGRISIRRFYLRRIFRIWPLYYLLVFLAFFVFPHISILHLDYFNKMLPVDFGIKLGLFIFILPNLALAMFPHASVPLAGHSWSIGVEEQFYILWPWIIRKSKNLMKTILIIGLVIVLIKVVVLLVYFKFPQIYFVQTLKEFVAMTKMECMVIGAAGALLVYHKMNKWLNLIFHPVTQIISIAVIPVLVYLFPPVLQDGEHIVFSFAFLAIIINVAVNPNSFLKLENNFFNFLGNISYGIYMYHFFIIVLVIRFAPILGFQQNSNYLNFYYYVSSFLVTIIISALSYYLFERYFIRWKNKFAIVLSGSEAKNKEL
ncbi:hypothetical protein BH09BAC5_BH09BAC5_26080 [soil metagenome]